MERRTIRERALAIPQVDDGELVTEQEALAFFEDARQNNRVLYDHLNEIIDRVDDAFAIELGESMPVLDRRAVVARGVITGAAQLMSDTGRSMLEIDSIKQKLGITESFFHSKDDSAT